jgi:hypothetical protein
VGVLDIEGDYTIVDSIVLKDDLILLVEREPKVYQLYKVNLETAATTLLEIQHAD